MNNNKNYFFLEGTDNNFNNLVLNKKNICLVVFWADWCGICKNMLVILKKLSKYVNKLIFITINIEKNPILTLKYAIRSIPSFLFFKNSI